MSIDDRQAKAAYPILTSLAAFAQAAVRPQTLLARAIVAVLVIKLFAVGGMMLVQHYADRSAVADAAGVADRLGPSSLP
jgi:hypothetical protein